MPTCTPYSIKLENIDTDDDSYFTLESCTINGQGGIKINGGESMYYKSLLDIKGSSAGLYDSFFFISQSNKEKIENINIRGNNTANIINLKIKKWKRESFFPIRLIRSCFENEF